MPVFSGFRLSNGADRAALPSDTRRLQRVDNRPVPSGNVYALKSSGR